MMFVQLVTKGVDTRTQQALFDTISSLLNVTGKPWDLNMSSLDPDPRADLEILIADLRERLDND